MHLKKIFQTHFIFITHHGSMWLPHSMSIFLRFSAVMFTTFVEEYQAHIRIQLNLPVFRLLPTSQLCCSPGTHIRIALEWHTISYRAFWHSRTIWNVMRTFSSTLIRVHLKHFLFLNLNKTKWVWHVIKILHLKEFSKGIDSPTYRCLRFAARLTPGLLNAYVLIPYVCI